MLCHRRRVAPVPASSSSRKGRLPSGDAPVPAARVKRPFGTLQAYLHQANLPFLLDAPPPSKLWVASGHNVSTELQAELEDKMPLRFLQYPRKLTPVNQIFWMASMQERSRTGASAHPA